MYSAWQEERRNGVNNLSIIVCGSGSCLRMAGTHSRRLDHMSDVLVVILIVEVKLCTVFFKIIRPTYAKLDLVVMSQNSTR